MAEGVTPYRDDLEPLRARRASLARELGAVRAEIDAYADLVAQERELIAVEKTLAASRRGLMSWLRALYQRACVRRMKSYG